MLAEAAVHRDGRSKGEKEAAAAKLGKKRSRGGLRVGIRVNSLTNPPPSFISRPGRTLAVRFDRWNLNRLIGPPAPQADERSSALMGHRLGRSLAFGLVGPNS